MSNKVVIWGYPPDTHTHSYIHLGFAKAFAHLDYDVVWYDDSEEYANEDLKDAIVISESNCCKYLPIEKSSQYFIHNITNGFYEVEGDNIHNLLVYHEKYNWDVDWQFIDDWSWYDSNTKTVVVMWATDLTPDEIDDQDISVFNQERSDINYVGSLDRFNLNKISSVVSSYDKKFLPFGGYGHSVGEFVDNEKSIQLVKNSYLNFDIRPQCHIDNGYIPCRIFKNMSYGCWTGTNSPKILEFFEGRITACNDFNELYLKTEEDSRKATKDILLDNQDYIKKNHTYINRAKSLLAVL